MAIIRWLILAFQFGTVIPLPQMKNATLVDVQRSVLFFPAVGGVLGIGLWAVVRLLALRMPSFAATMVGLALYTLATGALHIDGLMDTFDALGSRRNRERALEIMRDSRVGALGAVAGMLLLLGKAAALSALPLQHPAIWIMIPVYSRLGMMWAMCWAPYARQDQGLGGLFAKQVPAWVIVVATIGTVGMAGTLLPWQQVAWLTVVVAVVTLAFTAAMRRRFGGMTGDTYGALNELLEWIGWNIMLLL